MGDEENVVEVPKRWLRFDIKPFKGHGTYRWNRFQSDYDTHCLLNGVPEEQKVLLCRVYVKDVALSSYVRCVVDDPTWEDFCQRMATEYETTTDADRTALSLTNIKQRSRETVEKFYSRLLKAVNYVITPEVEPYLRIAFRKGLRKSLRTHLLGHTDKTLSQLKDAAQQVELGLGEETSSDDYTTDSEDQTSSDSSDDSDDGKKKKHKKKKKQNRKKVKTVKKVKLVPIKTEQMLAAQQIQNQGYPANATGSSLYLPASTQNVIHPPYPFPYVWQTPQTYTPQATPPVIYHPRQPQFRGPRFQQFNTQNRNCFNCHSPGHIARNCPRKTFSDGI